jgi:choline dehydrogenase-like flavoprotein
MEDQDRASVQQYQVIIVGAGAAGISVSHELTRAKIDHIVLERGRAFQVLSFPKRILIQLGYINNNILLSFIHCRSRRRVASSSHHF